MENAEDIALVYTVCASEEEALGISRRLVEERLAACTNYWPIRSTYRWQGELVEDAEVGMIIKTVRSHVSVVAEVVREMHSYELPCILQLSPEAGEPGYMGWLREGSAGAASLSTPRA